MPSINMIAARREEKRRQQQNIRKLLMAIAAEAAAVLVVATLFSLRIAGINGHIDDLSGQIRKLQPRVQEIQHLQQTTAELTPKVQTLDGAKSDILFWYTNLFAITSSLPQGAWLTALSTTGNATAGAAPGTASGTDPVMSITGVAASQATVGKAMLRMNQSPSLDHADLAFVQQSGPNNNVNFQMTVHLKPEPSATAGEGASNVHKS